LDNPDEAAEVVIDLLTEQNKLLLQIRNLSEDHTQIENLTKEIHRLASVVGKQPLITSEGNTQSKGRKPLPTPSWFQDGEVWLCEKPEDAPKGKCKNCGEEFFWTLAKSGKKVPLSQHPDFPGKFAAHFKLCPEKELYEAPEKKVEIPKMDDQLPF
jgi:hypothetical protein